jgi:hypothetical protein
MKSTIQDREFSKFRDGETGDAVAFVFDQEVLPVETAGVDWDLLETTFPSSTSDLFTYKKNSITVQTVLVTYENSSKNVIISISKTRL